MLDGKIDVTSGGPLYVTMSNKTKISNVVIISVYAKTRVCMYATTSCLAVTSVIYGSGLRGNNSVVHISKTK